jgi:hypothetical protein
MLGIAVILASFAGGVLGLIHSHKAKRGQSGMWGLTRLGATLIAVSSIGLLAGVAKEVATIRSGAKALAWQAQTTEQLKQIHADLLGVQSQVADPAVAAKVGRLASDISSVASQSRGSDFSNSDFSFGDFSRANFKGALFAGSNLSGADMSTAVVDSKTKLPRRR